MVDGEGSSTFSPTKSRPSFIFKGASKCSKSHRLFRYWHPQDSFVTRGGEQSEMLVNEVAHLCEFEEQLRKLYEPTLANFDDKSITIKFAYATNQVIPIVKTSTRTGI
jgi:hypothetical protein